MASSTPDQRISMIREERDLTKHLVMLDGPAQVLFPSITNLGAYRWVDDHTVAMPAIESDGATKLVIGDVATGRLDPDRRPRGRRARADPRASTPSAMSM